MPTWLDSAPYFDSVVFDCDGVLVDSEVLSMKVSQRIVADLGWRIDLATMLELFTGCSHEFFVDQVERHIGRRLEPGWDAPYRGWLEEALENDLQAIPGIRHALDRIDLSTAVASNSRHERIRMSLDLVGLLERFEGRISSAEDVAAGKPAPDVYLHAARLLGVPPHRCIAIDDSAFGVEAAHRAGMYVLAYVGHGNGDRLPRGERIRHLHDMRDLPDAVRTLASTGSM
jgi:HAD superfamily hydrolase (TIGR01509 family)